ncbi:MAG: RecX family transcriptional regulator [Actinobacteria bacterium HGW-Actinobacteria-1]|nr:MAG: RecX family transcriptional regulator [Actinobacteria bacterium HGW-Actinobacteria-1]
MSPGVITAITAVRVGGRARVIEVDGVAWRTTSAATIRLASIREGDVVTLEALEQQVDEAERQALRDRALAVLAYRERSVSELRTKLLEDGYPPESVATTVSAFERSGLVDDVRFADSVARSAAGGRGLGRRRAERDLASRGVADDVAAAALDQYMPAEGEHARAVELALRLRRTNERVDRLAARLVRKGFAPFVAFGAAREALSDLPDDDSVAEDPDL